MFSSIQQPENQTHSESPFMSSLGKFVSCTYDSTIPDPMLRTCVYETQVGKNTEYAAGISVDYDKFEFSVMMKKGEDGKVKFEQPNFSEYIKHGTQMPITQDGGFQALIAIKKYIEENSRKKYGSFFGLIRNSNSFVKYVLKHTQDPNAQKLGKLHSPFTAERAADKVWTNANANPEISVKDLRTSDSNQNLADWMEGNKQFAHIKTLLPEFFNNLGWIIMYHGSRTEYEKTHPSLSDSYESKMYDDNEIPLHAMGDGSTLREVRDDIRKKGKAARDAALPAIKYAYEHGQISISDAAVMLDRNSLNPEEVFNN